MKKLLVSMVILLSATACVNAAEATASEGMDFDLSLDFNSKNVWRGQVLSDDWVMQPAASLGLGNFTLGILGAVDLTDDQDSEWDFTKVDYFIDYTAPLSEGIDFSVGYIYYDFDVPGLTGSTNEFYGGLSFDTVLNPSVTWFYDFDYANGSYIALGLGHTVALADDSPLGLDLGLNLGWADSNYNEAYFGSDDSGFNDLTLSAGLPVEMGTFTVTPVINYSMLLDSDVRDGARDNDVWYGGVGLSTSF